MKTTPRKRRWLGAVGIALAAALLLITPALAQDSSGGDITLNEDVTGNQYLFGNTITVNGDVDGDLTAFGRSLTINGDVTGDVLFGGSWLKVNGKVDGDVRAGGAILVIEDGIQVGGDLMAAGYSVEMMPGSTVGGQALAAGAQVILEDVTGDVKIGAGSLRVNGDIDGDVEGSIGSPDQSSSGDPFIGMRGQDPGMPQASTVPGGLSFGSDGKIKGNLDYSATKESRVPSGAVGGKTDFTLEVTEQRTQKPTNFFDTDTGHIAGYFLASLILLTLIGGLWLRVRPSFLSGAANTLRQRFLASLGVGLLGYAVFFGLLIGLFILIFILVLPLSFVSMGQRFFGAITLTSLGASTFFVFVTNWLAPMVVALVIGEWIYGQIDREHKSPFWSLVIGLVIVLLAVSIPTFGRSLIAGIVAVFGLGAVVLYLWPSKPAPADEAPPAEPAPAAK